MENFLLSRYSTYLDEILNMEHGRAIELEFHLVSLGSAWQSWLIMEPTIVR